MDLLMHFLNIVKKHYLAVIYRLLLLGDARVDSLKGVQIKLQNSR